MKRNAPSTYSGLATILIAILSIASPAKAEPITLAIVDEWKDVTLLSTTTPPLPVAAYHLDLLRADVRLEETQLVVEVRYDFRSDVISLPLPSTITQGFDLLFCFNWGPIPMAALERHIPNAGGLVLQKEIGVLEGPCDADGPPSFKDSTTLGIEATYETNKGLLTITLDRATLDDLTQDACCGIGGVFLVSSDHRRLFLDTAG